MNNRVILWAILGLSLWAGLRWFERLNLYFPSRVHHIHPGAYGIPHAEAILPTPDGEKLHAWYIDAGVLGQRGLNDPPLPEVTPLSFKGQARTLVFFHGNGGNMSHRIQKLRIFREMGLSVFMFDYRGYGKSSGRPSEQGTYTDGEAAIAHLQAERGLNAEDLIYYGESLGCAVALQTALTHPPAALILDSPFTSTVEMGKRIFPFLPVRGMVRYRYDNAAKIGAIKTPLLFLHSPKDDIVPYDMGRSLFAAAPEPKFFVDTRGNHNDGFLETPDYGPEIRKFLARLQ